MALHPINARRNRKHFLWIGNLHHWSNSDADRHNHNTSKNTTRRTINIGRRKIKEEGGRKENRCLPPSPQPIVWVWIVNSSKIARWCQGLRFQVSLQRKNISSTYLISITSFPEDEQTSKHGEEVGTVQFRVQGEEIKKWWKKKKKKKEFKEKKIKKKYVW
jgi:hypothetical protein